MTVFRKEYKKKLNTFAKMIDKYQKIMDEENELLRKKLKEIDYRFYMSNALLLFFGCISSSAIIYVHEILLFLNKYM